LRIGNEMGAPGVTGPIRFGEFELDVAAAELRRNGVKLKLQPQPFKLLVLLASRAGALVTRDEIRQELWQEGTYVDFDQSVNFSIKQVRDVLRDIPDRPLYIETVPKRGYRFIAPVNTAQDPPAKPGTTTVRLQKALWTNIAELRMAEARRQRHLQIFGITATVLLVGILLFLILSRS
jgi:DNA-binding winged helix-turn-helix (wHTH) protein